MMMPHAVHAAHADVDPRRGVLTILRWAAPLLAVTAAVMAARLSWLLERTVPGCSAQGCADVLTSPWSRLAGVPVSTTAALFYGLLTAALLLDIARPGVLDHRGWTGWTVVGCLTGAAAWFIGLQAWVVHAWCWRCMSLHLLGLILAACLTARLTLPGGPAAGHPRSTGHRPRSAMTGTALGLAVIAALAAVQVLLPSKITTTATASITTVDNPPATPLNLPDYLRLGSADAAHHLVFFFDYTCPHCRLVDRTLRPWLAAHPEVALFLAPVPLDPACNSEVPSGSQPPADQRRSACEYARLMLAVARIRPEALESFHRTMMTPPSLMLANPQDSQLLAPGHARAMAQQLVGRQVIEAALQDPDLTRLLAQTVEAWKNTGLIGSMLPLVVVDGRTILSGEIDGPTIEGAMTPSSAAPPSPAPDP